MRFTSAPCIHCKVSHRSSPDLAKASIISNTAIHAGTNINASATIHTSTTVHASTTIHTGITNQTTTNHSSSNSNTSTNRTSLVTTVDGVWSWTWGRRRCHVHRLRCWHWNWHRVWDELLHILDDLALHCAHNFPHLFNRHRSWDWHLSGLWDRDRTSHLHSDWVGHRRRNWHRIWRWYWIWAIHHLDLGHIHNFGDCLDAISGSKIALRSSCGCQSKDG